MGRLDDKVAIVTGGASGIGRATVVRFAAEGASVVIADINREAGEAVASECRRQGGKAVFQLTDVTREEDMKALVDRTVREFGRLDVIFNNAGGGFPPRPIEETPVGEWDHIMVWLTRSVFLGMKYAIPAMRRSGGGSIISTGSAGGTEGRGEPGIHAYCAAKAAVMNMTQSVAAAVGKDRIRVNCINPGWTLTPAVMKELGGEATAADLLSRMALLPRAGRPEDIAAVAVFLASDDSSWVTGVALPADGGQRAIPGAKTARDVSVRTPS